MICMVYDDDSSKNCNDDDDDDDDDDNNNNNNNNDNNNNGNDGYDDGETIVGIFYLCSYLKRKWLCAYLSAFDSEFHKLKFILVVARTNIASPFCAK